MPQSTRYRMYVDESGDHVLEPSKWSSPEARYLGLTGVVIASETYRTRTHPEFEALKQELFPHDPVILVRNQIVNGREKFSVLRDPEVAAHWEDKILLFFDNYVSQIITVVLDKEEYLNAVPVPTKRPYSYGMNALTNIYDQWLGLVGGTGDVMAESCGKNEDRELKRDFQKFMTEGGSLPDVQESRRSISSSQIKLSLKTDNITGLQLADLFAHPSKRGILLDNGRSSDNPASQATLRFIEAVRLKSHHNNRLLP